LRIGGAGRAPLPLLLLTFVCIGLVAGTIAASARAAGCPNEQLREQDGYALRLPDCRAYEQASPLDKNFSDALGESDVVQSSPSGDGVTFSSDAPFPDVLSATSTPLYLGTRADGEWSTQGLMPPTIPRSLSQQGIASVLSLTEDLSEAIVNTDPGLEGAMASGGYSYLRDNATGSFRLLAPGVARFADATPNDSRIIFEDTANELVPGVRDEAGVPYLYEWNAGNPPGQELSLAGVLPDGEAPNGGSVAGPGGPALSRHPGGATGEFYTQDTISEDGSRIFFSDAGTGRIYMREPEVARTIPVSAGVEPAYWRAATSEGSMVFYTEGEDLYRFNVNRFEESKKPEPEALTEAREALTTGPAGVLGTLGIATENGSYAYFVATGVLASNENGDKEKAEVGEGNLYEWHAGETVFIARLSTEDLYDEYNWRGFYRENLNFAPATGEKSSRVTPDGEVVLFTSQERLTAYDNAGQGELYLYDATSGRLTCVSCNPSGAPATSEAYLTGNPLSDGGEPHNAFLTRNLSEDGNRVFFQTDEAFVPQDTNGQTDVYEWEREGTASCARTNASFSVDDDGCLYLISTGQSAQPSYFGDASASGDDVFFFTRQSLVGQDRDENYDIYDARVDGGIAAQNPPPSTGCTGEGCLAPVDPSAALDAPASATFSGTGNLKPPPTKPKKVVVRCPKGKRRSHGKCRRKKKAKRASRDRGTSR
jgi:hypothetical protein